MRICICSVLTPFVHGGAEILVDLLEQNLRSRGHEIERVTLPFKWFPKEQILRDALAWRLLDFSGSYFQSVDRIICTKFPSYLARHPNKVVWLFHQHREIYDFYGSHFSSFGQAHMDQSIRQMMFDMDATSLSESKALYTISQNVSKRLQTYNSIQSQALYPPPRLIEQYRAGPYENFILSVGRLELNKRVDLLIRAMAEIHAPMKALIIGQGPQRAALEALTERLKLTDRVHFLGFVQDAELLDYYSRARMVYYAPIDEDYGFVTIEAFLSERPVITCPDSGGVLEFVTHEQTGLIAEVSTEQNMAKQIQRLAEDEDLCRALGKAGQSKVSYLNWDYVVQHLLGDVQL